MDSNLSNTKFQGSKFYEIMMPELEKTNMHLLVAHFDCSGEQGYMRVSCH